MAESVVKCSYNGTEYNFVCTDPAQIEDLKCPSCLELVYEPVLTSCGHLFCQRCVRSQKKCPTCRKKLQCKHNQHNERRVKGLKVKCPNWERGCKWQGDLGDTAQHADTNYQMGQSEVFRMMATGRAKYDTSHLPVPCRRWLQNTPTCYPRPPWVVKMEGFQKKKEKNEEWFSDPVYSRFGGYKMCLRVDANGHNEGKGTHVSVYAYMM